MMQKTAWVSMTILAILVAAYAGSVLFVPFTRPTFVQEIFLITPVAISMHIAGSLVALVIGAFQLNSKLRARFLISHRWLGRTYVPAVIIGGVAGFVLALGSFGGYITHFGFGLMAILWVSSTLIAFWHIRRGDISKHRTWMIRSYALTLAAVTLRIYLPLSQVSGVEFETAYQVVSWLCWVPNVLIAEFILISRLSGKSVAS